MRPSPRRCRLVSALALALWVTAAPPALGCEAGEAARSLEVTATAYNSLAEQTQGNPSIAAWGDRLEPGMRAIAVSRDLLALGLTHRVEVCIEGLPGSYRVLDKMAKRWQRKIDIYMGTDVRAARAWGRRTVRIRWTPPPP